MAEHKVPQDVEAEDKLLGPFSFRQFVYLMIALAAGALAFFMGRVLIPLAILPMPIALAFLVLALPLRKDQPMETYVAAMIRFLFSPHIRLWDPDGQDNMVQISNPVVDDELRTKEFTGEEAARRLSFLAELEDTQGWSTRGVGGLANPTILTDDLAAAAATTHDILDDGESLSQSFDQMLDQSGQRLRAAAVTKMQNDVVYPAPVAAPMPTQTSSATFATFAPSAPALVVPASHATPLPSQMDEASAQALLSKAAAGLPQSGATVMHQKVIQPMGAAPITTPAPILPPTQTAQAQTPTAPSPTTSQATAISDDNSAIIDESANNTAGELSSHDAGADNETVEIFLH